MRKLTNCEQQAQGRNITSGEIRNYFEVLLLMTLSSSVKGLHSGQPCYGAEMLGNNFVRG
jgi:hypothetical protein